MLTQYNDQTITYDEIGNPINYRNGMTMSWQAGRQLATLSQNGKNISYTYDSNGLRTKKSVTTSSGTTEVEYFYEGSTLMQMKKGSINLYFFYNASGTPLGFIYCDVNVGAYSRYYYGVNTRGDIIALYNSSGTVLALYDYDAYGNPISVTNSSGTPITSDTALAHLNPLRYRGYVYDDDTGLYYLQSRYYDPITCRFINADSYISTGQDINGFNMFTYCNNNPVCFDDPKGMWKQVSGGWQAQSGDTLWCLAEQVYGNGSMWIIFGFSRSPETLQVGEVIYVGSSTGNLLFGYGGLKFSFRDVTEEVNSALSPYIKFAEELGKTTNAMPLYEPYRYGVFGLLVNHKAAWDIKRKVIWETTIGTPFPGTGALVTYQGMLMTPENLGNYTYGLLGAAFGIPYQTLVGGSSFAAITGNSLNSWSGVSNEIGDWNYIALGYLGYYF